LAAKINGTPALYLAPFGAATLPGVALPATKFAFLGDFSQSGNPPALATITANFFHLSGNATVLEVGDIAAAWVGVAVGAQLLAPPVAGANTEQVQTRNSMPVPHAYTNAVLHAYANGILTWEWFWTNVGAPIIVDPTQAADLEPFTNYLRVSSTQRPPAAAGGADRAPATQRDLAAVATTPAIQDQAMAKAREFLPGLRQPVGIGAQLNLFTQQNQAQTDTLVNAQQEHPVMMARKAPALLVQVQKMCKVPLNADESELGSFWQQYPFTPAGCWMGALKSVTLSARLAIATEGGGRVLTSPIYTPAFVTDVGEGNFFAKDIDDITSGLSIFRTCPANSVSAESLTTQNRMHTILVTGTGVAQTSMIQMLATDDEIEMPTEPFIFIGIIEAYYLTLLVVCGRHN
jgi:hypothetical protein